MQAGTKYGISEELQPGKYKKLGLLENITKKY